MTPIDASTTRQLHHENSTEDDSIDIGHILGVLWRGRWRILIAVLIGSIAAYYYANYVAVPKYRATTSMVLETQGEQVVNIDSVISGIAKDFTSINTQLQVIRSRKLIEELVDQLDLLSDPEFNGALRPPPRFSLRRTIANLLQIVRPASETETSILPAPTTEATQTAAERRRDSVVSAVQGAVAASNLRNTYILNIAVTTTNSQKSRLMANTLADLYIRDQVNVKYQATENATFWLSQRVVELGAELKDREDELKALRGQTSVTSAEEMLALNTQFRELRSSLSAAQDRAMAADADITNITRIAEIEDPTELIEALLTLGNTELLHLARQAQNNNTNVSTLLASRFDSMLLNARQQKSRAELQARAISSGIEEMKQSLDLQSANLQKVQQVERELQATRTLYETFLTRLKETSVQRGLQQADSRILSLATRGRNIEPQKSRIVALGGILGFLSSAAFLFVMQFAHRGLRGSQELEQLTGRPVLGQIPVLPRKNRKSLITFLNENPTSVPVEAYRNLRTSLLLSNLDRQPQIIMITSSIPGEGKTTNAISLAHNFASMGKRALLVECDMRRQTLSQYFEIEKGQAGGLISAMTASRPLQDCIIHDERLGADVLLGERSKVNPADTFSSETFRSFLESLRQHYDFIILDTPPVLIAPDARIIGQVADAILYAVSWDKTSRNQVRDGLHLLDMVNARVSGLVLTMIDPKGMKRYGYGDSYGSYAYDKSGYYNT